MIDIVYQYLNGPAQWEELRYSLRSLDKYFKDDFRVVFVGDMPSWVQNAHHIPMKRLPSDFFPVALDAARKMNATILSPEISDEFIYMYDDIYFLRPTSAKQVDKAYSLPPGPLGEEGLRALDIKTKHQKLKLRTLDALRAHGKCVDGPVMDTETHLPKLYNKEMMVEVFKTYEPGKNRLLFSMLYFNHHQHRKCIYLQKDDAVKAEFCGPAELALLSFPARDTQEILEVFKRKRFLNHNNMVLHKAFTDAVMQYFPEKSQFEK